MTKSKKIDYRREFIHQLIMSPIIDKRNFLEYGLLADEIRKSGYFKIQKLCDAAFEQYLYEILQSIAICPEIDIRLALESERSRD